DPVATIIHGQQNQHAPVVRLRSDAPSLVQINCVAFNIPTVERMDRDYGNLRVSFVVNLLAQAADGLGRLSVDHAGKIVDVACGFKLLDRLSTQGERQTDHG